MRLSHIGGSFCNYTTTCIIEEGVKVTKINIGRYEIMKMDRSGGSRTGSMGKKKLQALEREKQLAIGDV